MAYFVISNFSNGRDMRRSAETSPSGSLRVLRNAFINEGGEIEKRKAFVSQDEVTAYGQLPQYKGQISGPFVCAGERSTAFFRHRRDSLPGSPFVAGSGSIAESVSDLDAITGQTLQKFWVQKSTTLLPAIHALLHSPSSSEFSSTTYIVDGYVEPANLSTVYQHFSVSFTGDEPTSETLVAANDTRTYQRVLKNKGYVVKGRSLYGSAVGDPTDMAGTGFWITDLTTQGTPIGDAVALGDYFGQLVVFGTRGMMFWQVDPDPALNQYLRTIEGSTFGARSVTGYGAGDILYLARNGIRSLQARDSSNQARVSDVGSPIDQEIRASLELDLNDTDPMFGQIDPEVNNSLFYDMAAGIVHQDSGQFWLALRNQIHVLSRYPSAKVLAWSTFDLPDPQYDTALAGSNKAGWVADWCEINDSVVLRNLADEVYVYGGSSGNEYDTSQVEVVLPFMDMGRPGSRKQFIGVDIVCDGEWTVEYATAFTGVDRNIIWGKAGVTTDGTRATQKIGFNATGTEIALRLTCKSNFAARLSEILIHYNEAGKK